ncbi:MAG: 2-octaprenyl-6-methoxyphenol hydroxylase [Saprospiraceae bacterium]
MPEFLSKTTTSEYDVIIGGGGLVGSSLAIAMAKITFPSKPALKVALVEAVPFDSDQQASYDERTIALTYSSKLIFDALGVWQDDVASSACPLERIHISNRGHFGICNLDAKEVKTPALGYVCPTRILGKALYARIAQFDNIDVICPSTLSSITPSDNHIEVQLDQIKSPISANLVVIADGGRSPLLDQAGFTVRTQDYPSKALLSIVSVDRPHNNVAFERFTPAGPLALLPLRNQRYAAVWTETIEQVDVLDKLDDTQYLSALQSAFGYRAGLFSKPSQRKSYPLKQSQLAHPAKQRTLVLGNAAHTVHPVGGQGFNLGLRDVAAFAQLVIETAHSDQNAVVDIGDNKLLERYCQLRATETQRVAKFTESLLDSFSHSSLPISLGRNAALTLIENLPGAKRFLLRRTMGMAKHQPKLARGKRLFS